MCFTHIILHWIIQIVFDDEYTSWSSASRNFLQYSLTFYPLDPNACLRTPFVRTPSDCLLSCTTTIIIIIIIIEIRHNYMYQNKLVRRQTPVRGSTNNNLQYSCSNRKYSPAPVNKICIASEMRTPRSPGNNAAPPPLPPLPFVPWWN